MIETKIIICDQHIPEDQMQNNNVNLNTITCLGEERSSTLEQWQWQQQEKKQMGHTLTVFAAVVILKKLTC